jgi:hypothetical protein
MAMVAGSLEPLECDLAKFMGGTSEFASGTTPPTGSAKRIHLYNDTGASTIVGGVINSGTTAAIGTPPLPARSGTKPKVAVAGTVVTISLLTGAGLTNAYIGRSITLAGMSATNNGTWTIVTVPSATSVTVTKVLQVGQTGGSGTTWSVTGNGVAALQISGLSGMTAASVGRTLTLSGSANTAANDGSFTIASFVNATTVTITNASAVGPDANNGLIVWTEVAGASALPSVTSLFATQAQMNGYDQVLLGCGGASGPVQSMTATQQGYFYEFAKAGGRVFADHWAASVLYQTAGANPMGGALPWRSMSSWLGAADNTNYPNHGRALVSDTPRTNFKTWLTANGAYAGGGVYTPEAKQQALIPSATAFEWLRGVKTDNWTSTPTGDISLSLSVDTNSTGMVPTLLADGGAGAGCGRVVVNTIHVDTTRGSASGEFPTECNLGAGLSPNEAAFEYLVFVLSSCAIGGPPIVPSAPPAPTPPPTLSSSTFTREYRAVCGVGESPKWSFFNWQAVIPSGTSIVFSAQTAADVGGVAGAYGASVPLGTASTTTPPGVWVTQAPPCAVNDHLLNLASFGSPARPECAGATPAQQSQAWLKVTMTLNPSGSVSPVLQSWQQLYDCVPSE